MMQAIGLCRFSYPALGGFQIKHETNEERMAFCTPTSGSRKSFAFLKQSPYRACGHKRIKNWEIVIVIGDTLPKQHRDRLHDIVSDIPQISIQAHEPVVSAM